MARRPWATSDGAGTTARGYGWPWQQLRKRILERDCGLCCVCKAQGRIGMATDVDHIKRKADGGTDDEANLQSICDDCHEAKTTAENGGTARAPIGLDGWPIG